MPPRRHVALPLLLAALVAGPAMAEAAGPTLSPTAPPGLGSTEPSAPARSRPSHRPPGARPVLPRTGTDLNVEVLTAVTLITGGSVLRFARRRVTP
jgi:hypothetical protein